MKHYPHCNPDFSTPGNQRPLTPPYFYNPYSLILLYEAAANYWYEEFRIEERKILESEEDEFLVFGDDDMSWLVICAKYKEVYFKKAQALLKMLPEPPNVDKVF